MHMKKESSNFSRNNKGCLDRRTDK